ncbi:AIM24 family protein [Klugiella xanthotipulae]
MSLQNSYLLRSRITPGNELITRKGAMVAYQGNIEFKHEGSRSAGQLLRKMASSDDQPLMRVFGNGDVFFAHYQAHIHLMQLEGEAITINGSNLLAFQASLGYDINRVKGAGMLAGGMWNTTVHGAGVMAIATQGTPLILDCSQQPTFTDINATVAWSANLQPTIKSSMSAGALIGRGSGEAFQYAFHGPGWVIVQPSEFSGGVTV